MWRAGARRLSPPALLPPQGWAQKGEEVSLKVLVGWEHFSFPVLTGSQARKSGIWSRVLNLSPVSLGRERPLAPSPPHRTVPTPGWLGLESSPSRVQLRGCGPSGEALCGAGQRWRLGGEVARADFPLRGEALWKGWTATSRLLGSSVSRYPPLHPGQGHVL